MISGSRFDTELGPGGVLANERGLFMVSMPSLSGWGTVLPKLKASGWDGKESALSQKAAEMLERYYDGRQEDFDLPLDETAWSSFGAKVYRYVASIPYGETRTYSAVARECGSPQASRAVGRILAANRVPILIPCHRVIAMSGELTGFSAEGGLIVKAFLLGLEGGTFLSPTKLIR